MHLVERIVEPPHPCAYLPDRQASLDVRVMLDVEPAELEGLLEHGWRRFGPAYFRPACAACGECLGIRVPVEGFTPSKSQRRVARSLDRLRRVVGPPQVDAARLALYAAWHADREQRREWQTSEQTSERYAIDFAFPHPSAREAAFFDDAAGGRLVGVGIHDETPRALSAAYFFHDPAYARWSLGVANVLSLIADARGSGRPHLYLGYLVEGCASLRYKASYRPHELLRDRPSMRARPEWTPAGTASGATAPPGAGASQPGRRRP